MEYSLDDIGRSAPILIIGAGLSGLCLAQGLSQAGIPYAVYERDPAPGYRRQGYRLHIDSRGDDALRSVLPRHLHELFQATAGRPRPVSVLYDEKLTAAGEFELENGPANFNINRFTLRQILLEGLDKVYFGTEFVGYQRHGDSVIANFSDGSRVRGSILVGADGVNSRVRRQYLPHARVVDTGLRQLYGKIPLTNQTRDLFEPEMHTVFCMFGDSTKTVLGIAPVDYPEPVADVCARLAPTLELRDHDPYMTCALFIRKDRIGSPDDQLSGLRSARIKDLMLARMKGWDRRIRAMVESSDPAAAFSVVLRTSLPIGAWEPTNVTLLGDAAHAMSSAGASGANIALKDGATLAAAIRSNRADAIGEYEASMRDYGFSAVEMSLNRAEEFFGQEPITID